MNRLGFTHLSLRVEDLESVVAAVEQHAAARILMKHESTMTAWGTKAVFVTDPDGLRIELLQAPGDPDALPGA